MNRQEQEQTEALRHPLRDARGAVAGVQEQIAAIIRSPFHQGPAPEIVRARDALNKAQEQIDLADHALEALAAQGDQTGPL